MDILYVRKADNTMILRTEQDPTCNDTEVLIRYAVMNKNIERIITLLQSADTRVRCKSDSSERFVNAADIFYIESVDKRTFVYLEKSVYRTEFRLYQLAADLEPLGFVQISKSCILNINALECIKPLINSRMEATLKNGERLCITRKYLNSIKRMLQEGAGL